MQPPEATLLAGALRERPHTVAELASMNFISQEAFPSTLEALRTSGHLSISDGVISYHRPDHTVSDRLHDALNRARTQIDQVLEQAQQGLKALPELLQSWDEGASQEYRPFVDMISGAGAPADIWRLQANRKLPRAADICMPHVAPMFENRPAYTHAHWNAGAAEPTQVRFLISTDDAQKAEGRERILAEMATGPQFRTHPTLPSYFWITDDIVGIPDEWGQAWPEQVIAIRSRPLAAALTLVFENLWLQARPYDADDDAPWDPMLHLLSRGLTIEDAATACGLTARTGRRRVAEAMKHFGASSQFTLGMAWQESLTKRS